MENPIRKYAAIGMAALLTTLAGSIAAQTSRGTLTGIVTDQQAAAISGVSVELTNEATNVKRSSTTNESGFYRFDAVDLGDYSVQVRITGFQTYIKRSIPVLAGQTASIDVKLELGETRSTIEVIAQAESTLQYEAAVRGGNIAASTIAQMPMPTRRVTGMAFALPGVSTNRFGPTSGGNSASFAVNGMRARSNNFMIDGTENNDISVAGEGLAVTNPDAVAEVHIQTSNFDAEFGRSGGAVINVITKSGSNSLHGSAHYVLDSTYDDAISSTQSLSQEIRDRGRPPFGIDQWYGGTLGGPIREDRTFFFGSFQQRNLRSQSTHNLVTLTAAGRATLNSLYPKGRNANVDLYNNITGSVNADSQRFLVPLGSGRPALEFGTGVIPFATNLNDRQIMSRVDHQLTVHDQLSGRFILTDGGSPKGAAINVFPGFETSSTNKNVNVSTTETHIFSPSMTNELRLNYNRLAPNFPADTTHPLGLIAPRVQIAGLTSIGLNTTFPQGRTGNNYSFQDTVTIIRGAHSLRGGADLLVQRSRQFAPIAERGFLDFRAAGGFESFANYIDDFSGSGGAVQRDFGSAAYYPNMKRTAFFFQDRWRVNQQLTLTFGGRYEYFGVPVNSLFKASFSGLFNVDPVTFTGPYSQSSKTQKDLNNWSPSVGLAYSPAVTQGWLAPLLGNRKTVLRTGYQIGYESFFNNIASNAQTATPNVIATAIPSTTSAALPRGLAGAFGQLPTSARAPSPSDSQTLVVSGLVNPYVQRWSFGLQREIPANFVFDISYVGSKGTRLFINEDFNPLVPTSLRITPVATPPVPASRLTGRLDNLQGPRTTRSNGGSSIFHSLQLSATRRLMHDFTMTAAYTWSKLLDNASEVFAIGQSNATSTSAIPSIFGGQQIDRAFSLFDRTHRATFTWVYQLPWQKRQKGVSGHILGGWQMSSFITLETGVPLNVTNGGDADGLGGALDRPLFNPNGAARTRAVPGAGPTGYVNPDLPGRPPIDPATARFIALPNHTGAVVLPTGNLGRNTERTAGIRNVDFNLQKNVRLTEMVKLELRGEFFNLFNTPQYGTPSASPFGVGQDGVAANVTTSPAGRFLQPQFGDGGSRSVRYQLKLVF